MELTRKRVDLDREKRICELLIFDDVFCENILPEIETKHLALTFAGVIKKAVQRYWDKFKKAPKDSIFEILNDKTYIKELKKEEEDLFNQFISNLNGQYEKESENFPYFIDTPLEIDNAKKYLRDQALVYIAELCNKNPDEAEKQIKEYTSILDKKDEMSLEDLLVDVQEFNQKKLPKRLTYISPWLDKGAYVVVFGPKGVGKTMFVLDVAFSLTRSTWQERKIGPWKIENPAKVLYVEGEVGRELIQIRTIQFENTYGLKGSWEDLTVVFNEEARMEKGESINLSDPKWRENLKEIILKREYDIVILDNASVLCVGIKENDDEDWGPLIQWILDLKAHGVTTLLVAHATNKEKNPRNPRGSSKKEDPADAIIRIVFPDKYKEGGEDLCYMKVVPWSRSAGEKGSLKPFTLRYSMTTEDGKKKIETVTSTLASRREDDVLWRDMTVEQIVWNLLIETDWTQKKISQMVGIWPNEVGKFVASAMDNRKRHPLITIEKGAKRIRRATKVGEDYLKTMKDQWLWNLDEFMEWSSSNVLQEPAGDVEDVGDAEEIDEGGSDHKNK